jgi:hypothetical protein
MLSVESELVDTACEQDDIAESRACRSRYSKEELPSALLVEAIRPPRLVESGA